MSTSFFDDMRKLEELDSCMGAVITLMVPDAETLGSFEARDNLALLLDYLRRDWQATLERLRSSATH